MKNIRISAVSPHFASQAVVGLVAGLHAILFFAFFLSVFSATKALSAEDARCSGTNLIEQLAKERPAELALAREEAARTANSTSVFWKITKDGKAPSYLLGTMHSPDPRIARLEPGVKSAFDGSAKVLVESTDALDPAKMQAAMIRLKDQAFLPEESGLEKLIATDVLQKLQAQAQAHQVPWVVARRMQPWMIAAAIARPACETADAAAPVLDQLIAKTAIANGKELLGLETIDDQFRAVNAIPQEFHLNALADLVDLGDISDDVMETTKLLYLQGDTGLILPLVRLFSPKAYAGNGHARFQEELIGKRNVVMAQRASAHLEHGGVFIAVGAMHLPGDNGLVSLLRADGYSVEPLAKL